MLNNKKLRRRSVHITKSLSLTSAVLLSAMLLQACNTTPPLYHWGRYESLIYDMYNKPGNAPPQQQIVTLQEDIQQAEAQGRQVGPGIYAHLGFMYALDGKPALSEAAFRKEIALFPESEALIEGMLARAAQATAPDNNDNAVDNGPTSKEE